MIELLVYTTSGIGAAYCVWQLAKGNRGRKVERIQIDLIPYDMHAYNVRSRISESQWRKVAQITHQAASRTQNPDSYRCEICGERGDEQTPYRSHPVECHELWEFDAEERIQRLAGLISICPACHRVYHFGKATADGYEEQTKAHLMKVNELSEDEANAYVGQARDTVRARRGVWQLDLTYLNRPEFAFLKTKFTNNERWNCKVTGNNH